MKMSIPNSQPNTRRFENFISKFSILFLILSLFHQSFFCFINSHGLQISRGTLVIFEALLIASLFASFLQRINMKMLALIFFIFANAMILAIFQDHLDPKQIRNFLIPIMAIWLGSQYDQRIPDDRLVMYFALSIIAIGIFEAVFSNLYQTIFNVRQFHISIGDANESALKAWAGNLSLNGIRMGGRNMLAFIFGDHRISSVFLESASMANFGVIIAIWGLAKQNIRKLLLFLCIGLSISMIADSRFGVTIICVLIALRLVLRLDLLKATAFLMPLFILGLCLVIYHSGYQGMTDDFKGRLGLTGYFLSNFKISEFFGAYNVIYARFVDSGYPYILHFDGLILAVVLWVSFYQLKMKSDDGERLKSLLAIVIAANLAIGGDAIYALKLSGFMWFLIGMMTKYSQSKHNSQEKDVIIDLK